MKKSFKEIVHEESDEMVDMFLNNLPLDQKILMKQTIEQLINDVEKQIVEPILNTIELEEKR